MSRDGISIVVVVVVSITVAVVVVVVIIEVDIAVVYSFLQQSLFVHMRIVPSFSKSERVLWQQCFHKALSALGAR